jgi:hypothetical protein
MTGRSRRGRAFHDRPRKRPRGKRRSGGHSGKPASGDSFPTPGRQDYPPRWPLLRRQADDIRCPAHVLLERAAGVADSEMPLEKLLLERRELVVQSEGHPLPRTDATTALAQRVSASHTFSDDSEPRRLDLPPDTRATRSGFRPPPPSLVRPHPPRTGHRRHVNGLPQTPQARRPDRQSTVDRDRHARNLALRGRFTRARLRHPGGVVEVSHVRRDERRLKRHLL